MKYPDLFRYYDDFEVELLGSDKALLARENTIAFSIAEINGVVKNIDGMMDLFTDIKRFYTRYLSMKVAPALIYVYVWLDEMAGQIRASLCFDSSSSELPFKREFKVTEDARLFAENIHHFTNDSDSVLGPLLVLWLKL